MNEHIHFIMAIITASGCSVPLFVVLVSSCLLIVLSNEHAYHITIFPVHDFLLIQVIYGVSFNHEVAKMIFINAVMFYVSV